MRSVFSALAVRWRLTEPSSTLREKNAELRQAVARLIGDAMSHDHDPTLVVIYYQIIAELDKGKSGPEALLAVKAATAKS